MTVSIIIAVKTWQKNLENCVARCLRLDYPDYEILIMPDHPINVDFRSAGHPVRVIPTGNMNPARKRDLGLTHARGEILALLDDDAYPPADWLLNAVRYFSDDSCAAVGGPAVTPEEDTFLQKAGGAVFSSWLVSGAYRYRYCPARQRDVIELPSCNFLVRARVMREIGGFNTDFWPGEDTKLCQDIIRQVGKRIIYAPDVLVYHHRRPLFIPHLKQVASYAIHRGYFVKKFPATSLKFAYFLPALLVSFIVAGACLAIIFPALTRIYAAGVLFYLALVLIFSMRMSLFLISFIFSGIIMTHLTYGIFFLNGLLARSLPEEKDTIA